MNKKRIFFIQAFLVLIILLLTWIIGYWVNNYDYFPLWMFGLIYMLMIGPIIGLIYFRLYRNIPLGNLGVAFKISTWIGVVIIAVALLYFRIWDYLVWTYVPEFSNLENLRMIIKSLVSIDFLKIIIHDSPYLITICLLYLSIIINKKLNFMNEYGKE